MPHQGHLGDLMAAFNQGSGEGQGVGQGERPVAGPAVVVPRPIHVPVASVPANVQRVPPGSESSLSEDELYALRARSARVRLEHSSPQAVPAVPLRTTRTLAVSDQDVPGTESASSSSDHLLVPGSRVPGSSRRLKEAIVPLLSSRRLKVLKRVELLSTKVRCGGLWCKHLPPCWGVIGAPTILISLLGCNGSTYHFD